MRYYLEPVEIYDNLQKDIDFLSVSNRNQNNVDLAGFLRKIVKMKFITVLKTLEEIYI